MSRADPLPLCVRTWGQSHMALLRSQLRTNCCQSKLWQGSIQSRGSLLNHHPGKTHVNYMEEIDMQGSTGEKGQYLPPQKKACCAPLSTESSTTEEDWAGGNKKPPNPHSIQKSWFTKFLWLIMNEEQTALFCAVCQAHPSVRDRRSRLIEGYTGPFQVETLEYHVKAHIFCVNGLAAKDPVWAAHLQSLRGSPAGIMASPGHLLSANDPTLYLPGPLGDGDGLDELPPSPRAKLEDASGNGAIPASYLDCESDLRQKEIGGGILSPSKSSTLLKDSIDFGIQMYLMVLLWRMKTWPLTPPRPTCPLHPLRTGKKKMVAVREADSQTQASAIESASHPAAVETCIGHCPPPSVCEGEVDRARRVRSTYRPRSIQRS